MKTLEDAKREGVKLNEIYCCDCLDLMKLMPDKSVDLVVTSPPYNVGVRYDNWNDEMDWDDYYLFCERWIKEIYRIMEDDGRVCIVHYLSLGNGKCRQSPLMRINTIAENVGLRHHGVAIWWDITLIKRTAWGSWLSASAPYINSPFEGILILYKNRWKKKKAGKTQISKDEFMESCSGIWRIPPEHNRIHPAPFPIKLAQRCIKLLSWETDTVFDPFLGSGTTAVASRQLGRNFIGCEISPKYCRIAEERIKSTPRSLFTI